MALLAKEFRNMKRHGIGPALATVGNSTLWLSVLTQIFMQLKPINYI